MYLGEIAVNAPGWKATPFPHQTSDIPSVVLFSRSNASAVFITKDNKHAYAVSDNRGKTWGMYSERSGFVLRIIEYSFDPFCCLGVNK